MGPQPTLAERARRAGVSEDRARRRPDGAAQERGRTRAENPLPAALSAREQDQASSLARHPARGGEGQSLRRPHHGRGEPAESSSRPRKSRKSGRPWRSASTCTPWACGWRSPASPSSRSRPPSTGWPWRPGAAVVSHHRHGQRRDAPQSLPRKRAEEPATCSCSTPARRRPWDMPGTCPARSRSTANSPPAKRTSMTCASPATTPPSGC